MNKDKSKDIEVKMTTNELLPSIIAFSKANPWASFIAGISLLIFTFNLSGLSFGTLAEKYYGLETKKLEQEFQLKLKSVDFSQGEIKNDVDVLKIHDENMDTRVTGLESKVKTLQNQPRVLNQNVYKIYKK